MQLQLCNSDIIVKRANNSESLTTLIDNNVYNLEKQIKLMKENKPITYNQIVNVSLYDSKDFYEIEYIYYNYIIGITNRINSVINLSLNDYLITVNTKIITIITFFSLVVIIFCLSIWLYYTERLINLITISRCTMKIIPSHIIIKAPEIENWIDNNIY